MIPVNPPKVNNKIKKIANKEGVKRCVRPPYKVAIQLKTLIPVGYAMIIVAAEK